MSKGKTEQEEINAEIRNKLNYPLVALEKIKIELNEDQKKIVEEVVNNLKQIVELV